MLLVKAGDLGIAVPDSLVTPEGRKTFQEARNKFITQAEFERALALAGRGTPAEYQRHLNDNLRRQKVLVAVFRNLTDERLIPPTSSNVEQVREMRRYLDRLRNEVPVTVYPDRAYAFAGIR